MFDTILKNANIVMPGKGIAKGSIAISDGKIAAVFGEDQDIGEAREVIDAEGKFVMPGAIETHSHLGLAKGDEDVVSETDAAALGGVTTVLFFLRQHSPYEEIYRHIIETAEKSSRIDYSFHIVLISEEHLKNVPKYVEEMGVTSFKFYMTYRGNEARTGRYGGGFDEFDTLDDGFMFDCFEAIGKYKNAMAIVHAEDIEIINRCKKKIIDAGLDDMVSYAASRPDFAEAEGVRRALNFGKETGCSVNILHLTSEKALKAFFECKKENDYVEVCQPYIMLSQDDVASTLFKVRPPLRPLSDKNALWDAIMAGKINSIGSDHVPRKTEEKTGSVWRPAAGLPGTQYLLLNMLQEAHINRGMPLEQLSELLSLRPAKLYSLDCKGDICVGKDADLVVVDFNKSTILKMDDFPSFSDYNVYEGKKIDAAIDMTMVRGRIVAKDGKLTDKTGGKFIFRKGEKN